MLLVVVACWNITPSFAFVSGITLVQQNVAHVPYESVTARSRIAEEEEPHHSKESRSVSSCGVHLDNDEYGYESGDSALDKYAPTQLDVLEMVPDSAIESYIDDDWEENGGDHSSSFLFHAGCNS
ncbi:hypothetical protein DOTSEDRAFT_33128 [Dothistroma septosporum NZE10]|uniref:Uncharacterized protein n=1 Tax=Dothistroma septosporum (strain NZE10 / CBS 128990) TaxID=675120 RepID=N1PVV0_DOTSN|nr:hypothetical protein DOTSEDRAFT_33128 [Dothistroma septosporum NZE10]